MTFIDFSSFDLSAIQHTHSVQSY